MPTVDATVDNLAQILKDNEVVILDFWAPWCGPCKIFSPTYTSLSDLDEYKDVVFCKVNTEDYPTIGQDFQVRSIPNLVFFKAEVILHQHVGIIRENVFRKILDEIIGLDTQTVKNSVIR